MSHLDDATNWAFRYYTSEIRVRTGSVEHGTVFWQDASGVLEPRPVPPMQATRPGEIDLYELNTGLDIMLNALQGATRYLGDYHSHADGGEYPTEVPSPHDLFAWGAACDLCPIWQLWGTLKMTPQLEPLRDLDAIAQAPQFQLVQPARYGDIIQIVPSVDRVRFQTLAEQEAFLKPMRVAYKRLVLNTGQYGSIREDQSGYRAVMKGFIADANSLLSTRVALRYLENPSPPRR